MIHGHSKAGDQPQIAEIEVYPALKAEARSWLADDRLLADSAGVRLPAGTRKLSFVPLCQAPAEEYSSAVGNWKDRPPIGRIRC